VRGEVSLPQLLHDLQCIAGSEPTDLPAGIHGLGDPSVGPEYEGRRLDMRPAVMIPRVAADGARRRLRIQAVEHPELEPEPLDRSPRVLSSIGRERHDLRARGVELRAVLLEVSQLLTTVASPVPPVEEEHGGRAAEPVRYAECAAVYGTPLKLGKVLADTKSFHDDRPSSNQYRRSAKGAADPVRCASAYSGQVRSITYSHAFMTSRAR
jgi:hypothetical protein